MTPSEKAKMLAGELYDGNAPEIQAELAATSQASNRPGLRVAKA